MSKNSIPLIFSLDYTEHALFKYYKVHFLLLAFSTLSTIRRDPDISES